MTSKKHKFTIDASAALCDVAPTVLQVMGIDPPAEMTGKSLISQAT